MEVGGENKEFLQVCDQQYEILDVPVRGVHGLVYKVVDETGDVFAIKRILLENYKLQRRLSREITLLYDLEHPHIVRFQHALVDVDCVYLFMEYVPCTLELMIAKYAGDLANLAILQEVLRQILSAVAYCHKRNIIHRDLKPANILIDDSKRGQEKFIVKVADFGMARVWDCFNSKLSGQVCTFAYRAPELFLGSSHYTPAVDLWSIGCILGEIVLRRPIFVPTIDNPEKMLDTIFRLRGTPDESTWPGFSSLPGYTQFSKYDPEPLNLQYAQLGEAGVNLLSRLLTLDPSKRINAEEALKHHFFSGL